MTKDISMTLFDISQIRSWLEEAGTLALQYYQTQLVRNRKQDYSPVTEADTAVERFLINKIEQSSDLHYVGIMAEESGGNWPDREFVWVIDPIDGTRVFIDGLPLWCISLGLLREGEAYRGVVYLPVINEIFYTNNEGIALWNDRPLQGMLRTAWDRDSFIAVPSGAHRHFWIDFRRIRSLGAIATHHVYVAKGTAVAALHRNARVWDLAGAQAILDAVGGSVVHLDGTPFSMAAALSQGIVRQPVLAGHPALLEKLLPRIEIRPSDSGEIKATDSV